MPIDISLKPQVTQITGDVDVKDRVARLLGQLTDGANAIDPRDIKKIAGIALTGRDWSQDFAKLDINLSEIRNNLFKYLETIGTAKYIRSGVTTNTTIYTVPTGKKFYVVFAVTYNLGAYVGGITFKDSAGNCVMDGIVHPATAYQAGIATFGIPYVLLAGYTIFVSLNGGTEYSSVFGYEV